MAKKPKPLTDDERDGIKVAARSVFRRLRKVYAQIKPFFEKAGFEPQSPGVIARDVSEHVETGVAQHCDDFEKHPGHPDLLRFDETWEVKCCKNSGLTVNSSHTIDGENYIVVNYREDGDISRIWVLWEAKDAWFSARKSNTQARRFVKKRAADAVVEEIYKRPRKKPSAHAQDRPADEP